MDIANLRRKVSDDEDEENHQDPHLQPENIDYHTDEDEQDHRDQ